MASVIVTLVIAGHRAIGHGSHGHRLYDARLSRTATHRREPLHGYGLHIEERQDDIGQTLFCRVANGESMKRYRY